MAKIELETEMNGRTVRVAYDDGWSDPKFMLSWYDGEADETRTIEGNLDDAKELARAIKKLVEFAVKE